MIQEKHKLNQCDFKVLSEGEVAAKITAIINWKKVTKVISDIYGKLNFLLTVDLANFCKVFYAEPKLKLQEKMLISDHKGI